MLRALAIWLTILNTSSVTLHNTTLVFDNKAIEIGVLDSCDSRKVEIPQTDSIRVIFTLGQEREEWLGTDMLPMRDACLGRMRDTIEINDYTETFEIVAEKFGE